jgi:alanyl-tRNA synthetase
VTERLYYTDPYLTDFEADIIRVEPLEDGRPAAVLNRTAFYPTSGGQPFDTGTLGAARVIDVVDRDDGTIAHVVEGQLPHGHVRGRVNWDRRFEHMQQHTGQHVLSAAFARLFNARTVSFHLGAVLSTIDLAPAVSPLQVAAAAAAANHVVWEDRPVTIRFADAAEAVALPLRKESAREGRLRLIEVEGFDLSACGGTHVARTGAIGILAIPAWERYKAGTRVSFAAGVRAVREYDRLRDAVAAMTRTLGTSADEAAASLERMQSELQDGRRNLKAVQRKLAGYEANALADGAVHRGGRHLVIQTLDGWDAGGFKALASSITTRAGYVAILVSDAPPFNVVVARAVDVQLDAAEVLASLVARFGGKGGGRSDLAQGGGLTGAAADVLEHAHTLV